MYISVEKFKQLDEHYVNMGEGYRSGGPVVEERILAYQRHLDERSRTELSLEVRYRYWIDGSKTVKNISAASC